MSETKKIALLTEELEAAKADLALMAEYSYHGCKICKHYCSDRSRDICKECERGTYRNERFEWRGVQKAVSP